MADVNNTKAVEAAEAKSVGEMAHRRFFADTTSAAAYLVSLFNDYPDAGDYEMVFPIDKAKGIAGITQDDTGALVFAPEIFPTDMRVMIAKLTSRTDGGPSKMKAIVIMPVPTLDAIIADKQGREWLDARVETEINRAAVRLLRDGKDTTPDLSSEELRDQLPKTLEDYVTSSTGGTSAALEAFENFWRPIKKALGDFSKQWKLRNISKKELRKAMSSTAYATAVYPTLEDHNLGKGTRGSLFALAIGSFIVQGKAGGLDVSLFEDWLAKRDETVIDIDTDDDEDEDDFELTADLLVSKMTATDETTESDDAVDEAAPAETTGE